MLKISLVSVIGDKPQQSTRTKGEISGEDSDL
jgi:hypothetical protein